MPAVPRRVLDLRANLGEGLPLPGHRKGREVPVGMARHADHVIVGRRMTRRAAHGGHPMPISAAPYPGLMWVTVLALQGPVAGRMTVDATRMLQDFPGFHEERHRALRRIR